MIGRLILFLLRFVVRAEDRIYSALVSFTLASEPIKHIRIQPDCQLGLSLRRDWFSVFPEILVEFWNVTVVNVVIAGGVETLQIAFDSFFVHGCLPSSWILNGFSRLEGCER